MQKRMQVKTNRICFEVNERAGEACFRLLDKPQGAEEGSDFWRLILDDGIRTEIPVLSHRQTGKVQQTERGLICEYNELVSEYGDVYPITFRVEVVNKEELLYFTPSLENRTQDVRINECFCPLADFKELYGNKEEDILYAPEGMGARISNPWKFMEKKASQFYAHNPEESFWHLHYPQASMCWFGVESKGHFLYVARYDKDIRYCFLTIRQRVLRDPGNLMLGVDHFPAARPGEQLTLPTSVVGILDGDWRSGAKRYRAWADENFFQVVEKAPWVQEMTGWQRLIMRSQYGEDYVKPSDLPEIYRVGAQYGLHTIFLFGWWKGGLDRDYPSYDVEPYPGAHKELRENIKKVQEMGGRIILVMGTHMLDASNAFWKEEGKDYAVIDINGEPVHQFMGPYPGAGELRYSYGNRKQMVCCSCSQGWRDQQLRVLKIMNDLGADCPFMDCYGASPWQPCFDNRHEHGNRIDEEWNGHRKSLSAARDYCAAEGKVLGVEVITDIAAAYVQFIHGCFNADFYPGGHYFPAMFRYTFPEVIVTNRGICHSYGDYVKQFKWSLVEGLRIDAQLWICRADIGKDPAYAAQVGWYTQMLNQYADYLLRGTFTVTDHAPLAEGIKCGEYIHKDGGKLLRILYNITDEPVEAFGEILDTDEIRFEEMNL